MSTKDFINLIKDNKLYDALELAKLNLTEQFNLLEDEQFDKIGCFDVVIEKELEKDDSDENDSDKKDEDGEEDDKDESTD